MFCSSLTMRTGQASWLGAFVLQVMAGGLGEQKDDALHAPKPQLHNVAEWNPIIAEYAVLLLAMASISGHNHHIRGTS
jgi:hypothetical protein